jgi:hypothetical protein
MQPNGDFLIPKGVDWRLPKTGVLTVKRLFIQGTLRCPSEEDAALTLQVHAIEVDGGRLVCGESAQRRFLGKRFTIQIRDEASGDEESAVIVKNGGQLQLHGRQRTSWIRLRRSLAAGSSSLLMPRRANWNVGEEVVVAPTDFDPFAYEPFEIRSVDKVTGMTKYKLNTTARVTHLSQFVSLKPPPNNPDDGSWKLTARAEAALLTRNIQIYGSTRLFGERKTGVHVIVMNSGKGMVDNVEIRHAGWFDQLGM